MFSLFNFFAPINVPSYCLNLKILVDIPIQTQYHVHQCNHHMCPQQLIDFWDPSQAQPSTTMSFDHSKKSHVELAKEKKRFIKLMQ
jgi:hypothetical protein